MAVIQLNNRITFARGESEVTMRIFAVDGLFEVWIDLIRLSTFSSWRVAFDRFSEQCAFLTLCDWKGVSA